MHPPYNKDKPYKNHGARATAETALERTARFWAETIRRGGYVPSNAISSDVIGEILKMSLLTRDQLQAAGVDC